MPNLTLCLGSNVREEVNSVSETKVLNKSCYEFFLIITSKIGEDETNAIISKFEDLIQSNGELKSTDKWGKRKFAYPINKETEGNYILFNFESKTDFPAELDRICRITDGVLRSLIVKKESEAKEDKENA